jgi:hypothetical protein
MFPRFIVLAALLSVLSTSGRCQDSQSLGEVARQSRSQKNDAQPKMVITNDNLPSSSAVATFGVTGPGDPPISAKPGTASSAQQSLARWESVVKEIDSMDRATLLKKALQGANPDFPGHGNWEDRLFAAKQTYVSQGLDLIQRAKQILEWAQTLQEAWVKPDDPRVRDSAENLNGQVRESVRSDAAFQAVILEGRDLARQTPGAKGP